MSQTYVRVRMLKKIFSSSWVEVSGLPRGALVEWGITAGLPLSAADGESGGGGDDDDKWDYKKVEVEGGEEDVISVLRYEKSKSTTTVVKRYYDHDVRIIRIRPLVYLKRDLTMSGVETVEVWICHFPTALSLWCHSRNDFSELFMAPK